jgi:hypothetical protein
MGRACSTHDGREMHMKRPLERPRHMLDNNTEINLREIRWDYMDWIPLAQDRDKR